jgi:hypothetical protein
MLLATISSEIVSANLSPIFQPLVSEAFLASGPMALKRCDHVQKVFAFIGLALRQFIAGSSVEGKARPGFLR